MLRKIIIASLAVVLLIGIYVSRFTLETVWAMAMTAGDVFSSSGDQAETANTGEDGKSASSNKFAAKFSNSLMVMEGGTPHSFDASDLTKVKYWAFYYGNSATMESRDFASDLSSFYRTFKPFHSNFELIFIDMDKSEDAMTNLMNNALITFPAVWYTDVDNLELEAKKYLDGPLPCLVLVDSEGRVLAETASGHDPREMIDTIRNIVP